MTRVAVVVSHPIPSFAPFHAAAAARPGLDLKVFFCCDHGAAAYHDPGFGRTVAWDVPLLDGYAHEFLPAAGRPRRLGFLAVDNPRVGERLEAFGPDVVMLHGYAARTHWRVARWARRRGVPVLLYSDSNLARGAAPWKRAIKAAVVRWFYRHVDAAFVTGDRNRAYHRHYGLPEDRHLEGLLPAEVELVRGALAGRAGAARAAVRARLGIAGDAFLALFCGKFVEGKRPGDLIDAVAILAARGADVAALLVGDGALRPALEARARSAAPGRVAFAGFVNRTAVPDHLAAADVLVLPSRNENQGLVVAEAAAAGVPAIVSDRVGCAGPMGFARPGETALVFPCGDVTALAECLDTLVRDTALRERMGRAAAAAAEGFGAGEAARRLEAAVAALVALGPRRRRPGAGVAP